MSPWRGADAEKQEGSLVLVGRSFRKLFLEKRSGVAESIALHHGCCLFKDIPTVVGLSKARRRATADEERRKQEVTKRDPHSDLHFRIAQKAPVGEGFPTSQVSRDGGFI